MAKRLNPRHQDMVRAKIQTARLLGILQEEADGKRVLRDGQRESAKFLINKSLANPAEEKTVTHAGDLQLTVVTGVPGAAG